MSADYTKLLKEHLKAAECQGFLVKQLKSGHVSVTNPDTGRRVNVPCTPSRRTTMMNAITRMRRIGYERPNRSGAPLGTEG